MPQKNRVLANFAFLTGGKFLGDIVLLVVLAIISRAYGPLAFGQYSIAMAIGGFLIVFSSFGLNQLSVKSLSRGESEITDEASRFLTTRFILSSVVWACLLIGVIAFRTQQIAAVALLIGSSQILYAVGQGFVSVLASQQMMKEGAALELCLRLLTLTGVSAAVFMDAPLLVTMAVFPIANAIYVIGAWVLARRRFRGLQVRTGFRNVATTMREAIPYGSTELLVQISARMDVVLIGSILGAISAGLYNAGFRIVFALNFIPALLAQALLPVLSVNQDDAGPQANQILSTSVASAVLIAIPTAVGVTLIAPVIVPAIFGQQFQASAPILQILSALIVLKTLIHLFSTHLIASDRAALVARIQWWGIVGASIIYVYVIRKYGVLGAAAATVIYQAGICIALAIAVRTDIRWAIVASRAAIASLGCLSMLFVWSLVGNGHITVSIAACALAFVVTIVAFPTIRRVEVAGITALVRRSGNQRAA